MSVLDSFLDEMQKIAGKPRAVIEGGGGAIGRLMREAAEPGKARRRAMGAYKGELDDYFRRRKARRDAGKSMALNETLPDPKGVRQVDKRYFTENQLDPSIPLIDPSSGNIMNNVSEVEARKIRLRDALLQAGNTRLGDVGKPKTPLAGLAAKERGATPLRTQRSDGTERAGRVFTFPGAKKAVDPRLARRKKRLERIAEIKANRERRQMANEYIDVDDYF